MSRTTAVPFVVPAHLESRQRAASDPATSIWVSANAGSGKTHVLTQRVIRLLLDGVAPAKVLCLTFTKAAAAQMATRVFETLSHWTVMDDARLREAILATGAPPPAAADLLLARRLFTRTVETPGGLKIQTIHAFCERLLHLFPFEANVPARFEVADERRMQEMLSLARRAAVAALKDSVALALVADVAGAFGLDRLLASAMAPRAAARRATFAGGDAQAGLATRLGSTFGSVDAVRRAMMEGGLAASRCQAIAEVLDGGLATDEAHAARLRKAVASARQDNLTEAIDAYTEIFFSTSSGEPRKRLLTGKLAMSRPEIAAELASERDRLVALRKQLKIAETVERTRALITIVDAIIERYEKSKIAQGLLDFDDLIERTLALLDHSSSGWVLHKLDAGIDHVLVDEAQDTSEAQWQILERLTGDFASGEGAHQHHRSFFVVGDDKQSIFSFQGAAPQKFDEMRRRFEQRFRAGRKAFARVELKTSFRSVPGILGAVDTVFQSAAHQDGLVSPGDVWPLHESIKTRLPGLIEFWPRLGAVPAAEPQDWKIPLDTPAENDPVNVVADRVARKIKALIAKDSKDRVHDGRGETPRPIRPGDILVLVRTRGAFFEAVIRALKHHYVAVAGADRLDVANHIAVMDLVAAGRTALMPADDLSLACLLKSPLFGLTDDDLIAIAPDRRGPLFLALAASPAPAHREAHAMIARWAARAAGVTPFAFYIELLGRDRGRFLMEQRLGPEAHDAIDEFLRLALAHERDGAPSLGAFLADVEALDSSIKRDMEAPGDAVRVMTVHAAKGLEAKVVFLPDTCAVPAQTLDPNVFDLNDGAGGPPLLAWSPRKGDDPPVVEVARAEKRRATLREYRRLLYVALTRAEERLYIAGFYNSREPPSDCWNTMIETAFPDAETAAAPWGDGDAIKRIATVGTASGAVATASSRADQPDFGLPPVWLSQPVAAPLVSAPLRPSRLHLGAAGAERRDGLTFGSALHLLLQYLSGVAAARRETAARAYLEARRASIPPTMHDALVSEALGVIAHPDLAALFGPEARAEVGVVGRLGHADGTTRVVRGVVDRLVVTPTRVIVADFKTGSPEPSPPPAYVEQLALYRRVLTALWPGRPLAVWLVWTRGPIVVEIDPAVLDATARAILASA